MPAEWERQEAVWLAWPHNGETWPGDALSRVRESYTEVIRHLSRDQRISLLVDDSTSEEQARQLIAYLGVDASAIRFLHIPTCDAWIRDYGPTFLVSETDPVPAMISWEFNAWGSRYPELTGDNGVPEQIAERTGFRVFSPGIVLEGGSIDVNGSGLLLTTEQCLLNPNRNPEHTRENLEICLGEYLGVSEVIWLGDGIVGDDTDGHVDDIARFVSRNTVVCAVERDPLDDNYRCLEDNFQRLTAYRDSAGNGLRVIPLPMPAAISTGGERLPASYANFYIGNSVVLVPAFGDPADNEALAVLRTCFPDRQVVGIDSRALVLGMGTLHCCSQQQPEVRKSYQ